MTRDRAAKYRRISDDREGRELGVERQDEDLDTLAQRRGLTVVADYVDNDIGASTRSKKRRPNYERMIADAKAGNFDVILAYTSSRLTRRPREHEDLIELAETHGIRYEYVRSPSFDLNTSAGRRIARILAANDAGESEDIAERVSRAAQQRAERGEFHGNHVTFGYEAFREVVAGRERITGLVPHPVHVEWLREAMERLLAGETLYSICVDWNDQGRTTGWMQRKDPTQPTRWFPRTLKRAVTNPTIAGYREYQGSLYEATQWQAIVDRDEWESLRGMLLGRSSSNFGPPGRKYMLSGLVYCATCDHVMVSMTSSRLRAPSFHCSKIASAGGCGSMRISMAHLEPWIIEQVVGYVDSPAFRRAMKAANQQGKQTSADEKALRKAIRLDEQALQQVGMDLDDRVIDRAEWRRRRDRLTQRIDENRQALERLVHTTSRVPDAPTLRRMLEDPDVQPIRKRTLISAVVDRIQVSRMPQGMASTIATPRKGEGPDDFQRRRDLHVASVMQARVDVAWV